MVNIWQLDDLPLSLGKFRLNLNPYRNAHYRTLSKLKHEFAQEVEDLEPGPILFDPPYVMLYEIWAPNAGDRDIDNIGTIIAKFTHDALVGLGILPEDNVSIIPEITFRYAGIDRGNPRARLTIFPFEE